MALRQVLPLVGNVSGLELAERLARPTVEIRRVIASAQVDHAQLVIDAYEQSATLTRRSSGIFYTPPAVVSAMLDRLPSTGTWLDPAAGAGAFLVAFVRRFGRESLERLEANDIDPEALDAAALALEVALGREARREIEHWRATQATSVDFLREAWGRPAPDVIVGNPPYGLSDDEQLATRFPVLRGEIDLYACFLLQSMARVRAEGTVALLVPDTWLTNVRDAGLRTALVDHGLERVVDFGKPFSTARDTRVHAVQLRRGASSCLVESTREQGLLDMAAATATELKTTARTGWRLYRTSAEASACRIIERGPRLGQHFEVIYGLRTGNNAQHVRLGSGEVPLVGGGDLDAYDRRVQPKHLADPDTFARALERQRGRLKLGVQRIRTNSRVSWRRWVEAAPLLPEEVGLDSLTLIASPDGQADEALWALLGVLCSSAFNRWYRLTYTDVNVKPRYLVDVPLPRLEPSLARLARMRVECGPDLPLERAIDRLVFDGYGLSEKQIGCFETAYWGPRLREVPLPSLDEALARSEEPRLRSSGPRLSL